MSRKKDEATVRVEAYMRKTKSSIVPSLVAREFRVSRATVYEVARRLRKKLTTFHQAAPLQARVTADGRGKRILQLRDLPLARAGFRVGDLVSVNPQRGRLGIVAQKSAGRKRGVRSAGRI